MAEERILAPIIEEEQNDTKHSPTSESSESRLVASHTISDLEMSVSNMKTKLTNPSPTKSAEANRDQFSSKYKAAEYHCCPRLIKGKRRTSTGSEDTKSYKSILERPFIFRRTESLDKAVSLDEKRLIALYRQQFEHPPVEEFVSLPVPSESTSLSSCYSLPSSKLTTTSTSELTVQSPTLRYAIESPSSAEEEGEFEKGVGTAIQKAVTEEKDDEYVPRESAAMTQAQTYLRMHRIFEFFQFLIAHLLSALPENPIEFIIELLDKCIIYRTGLGNPPLLYDKKHLVVPEVLFNVMDRMKTGYIDSQQYAAGLKTLGLCTNKESLQMNTYIQIDKETFVADALEGLLSNLNDMLRRKYVKEDMERIPAPPPTPLQYLPQHKASSETLPQDMKSKPTKRSNQMIGSLFGKI